MSDETTNDGAPAEDEGEVFFEDMDRFLAAGPDAATDELIDLVYMASPSDWGRLREAFPNRPAPWREALAYLLGEAPADEALPLLLDALSDPEPAVAREAARSLAQQHAEAGTLPDAPTTARLCELVVGHGAAEGEEGEALAELLERLGAGTGGAGAA